MAAGYPPQGGGYPPMRGAAGIYPPPQGPASFVMPAIKLMLRISCRELVNLDVGSKSDPMAVVSMMAPGSSSWYEIGRTATIDDTLNPDFPETFVIDYRFEELQKIKIDIYDSDSSSKDLSKHDYVGSMESDIGSIVSGSPPFSRELTPAKRGRIIVHTEEQSSAKGDVHLTMRGAHLDKKDFLGKSDPFFELASEDPASGLFTVFHKSEVIKRTFDPSWKPFVLPVSIFCNGDYDRRIRIYCYDWDGDGSHDTIGVCYTTLNELVRDKRRDFEFINEKKKAKKKNYKNSGALIISEARVEPSFSFLDFVTGGLQLNFSVAVDFTGSNGDPALSTSLHYLSPYPDASSGNQYTQAITAIGDIVQSYDTDKIFPAFGFGGKLPNGSVSHNFPLSLGSDANCAGVGGILGAYRNALTSVSLWGPTNFAPVISDVVSLAREAVAQHQHVYSVLLIITDGAITDMPNTRDVIVDAADLPMSIIIVGVGRADFSSMEALDGDTDGLKSRKGKKAARDIVQFVPFMEFASRPHLLAKEVLAEIPQQVCAYMKSKGVQPHTQKPAQ